ARQKAEDIGAKERWERYRANIATAASALQVNNLQAGQRALKDAPPEHRNWEWRHFHGQLDNARAVIAGPGAGWWEMLLSPDGKCLAAWGPNATTTHLWDPKTAKETAVLRGHNATILGRAFSPDGRTFATCSQDGSVRLWDTQGGDEIRVLRGG